MSRSIQQFLLPLDRSLFYKIRPIIYGPRELVKPHLHLCIARGEDRQYLSKFELDEVWGKIYFTSLHIWLINRRFHLNKYRIRKLVIWDLLWDYVRYLMFNMEVREGNFGKTLKKVQEQVYGLSLALDQSIDKMENEQFMEIKYALWVFLYNMDKKMESKEALFGVANYLVDMDSFIKSIPKEEFKQGAFIWPK